MNRAKATLAGLAVLVVSSAIWVYFTYDRLQFWSTNWFYRINALWHEHPEEEILLDPLFLLSLAIGAALTFGVASFLTAWLSPTRPWGPVALVIALGTLPGVIRGGLVSFTEASGQFKLAFAVYILASWALGLGAARLAVSVRSSAQIKRLREEG
jgi:hypothetical protein